MRSSWSSGIARTARVPASSSAPRSGIERRARRELFRVLVVLEDRAPVRARELDGPADDRGEDGVEIEGGADRPPDVPEGRELLDRAGELLRPRLQRAQQPGVLDRDHRLVREGLEERDLVVGEAPGFAAVHSDRSQRFVVTKERHHDRASVATDTSVGARGFGPSGIGVGVGHIERHATANDLGVRVLGVERLWEARPQGSLASIVGAREPGERDLIAGDPGQRTRVRPQQADGAGQDRVEHRLHIRLRLADDPQDVAGGGLRLQRRRQLAVARLELGEQPRVLDRDDGLIGEGLHQRHLLGA